MFFNVAALLYMRAYKNCYMSSTLILVFNLLKALLYFSEYIFNDSSTISKKIQIKFPTNI